MWRAFQFSEVDKYYIEPWTDGFWEVMDSGELPSCHLLFQFRRKQQLQQIKTGKEEEEKNKEKNNNEEENVIMANFILFSSLTERFSIKLENANIGMCPK